MPTYIVSNKFAKLYGTICKFIINTEGCQASEVSVKVSEDVREKTFLPGSMVPG